MKANIHGMEIEGDVNEIATLIKALKQEPLPTTRKEEKKTLEYTPEPIKATQKQRQYGIRRDNWTTEQDEALKLFYDKYAGRKTMTAQRAVKKLSREIGRSIIAIRKRGHTFGLTKKNKTPEMKAEQAVFEKDKYMLKAKPTPPPMTFDESMTKLANAQKYKKSKIKDEDLEFPVIYPLTEGSNKIFEQMLINAVANKGNITFLQVAPSLQTTQGSWDGRKWRDFCEQFTHNQTKISKALNISQGKVRVELDNGGYHIIKCE